MHNALLTLIVIALSATTIAANVLNSDTRKINISVKGDIQILTVETKEACIFTFDPQWADEEDTREAKTIVDDYKQTNSLFKKLKKDGFVFNGYQNNEKCEVQDSSFPEVLTSNDSLYFARFVSPVSMANAARKQSAFKKVKRVYIKGFQSIEQNLKKAINLKKAEIFKEYL
jgi:hypothetical protein